MNTDIEHQSLRQEIIESGSYAITAANIVVTITGVALVAAFQFQNSLIALLPLLPLHYSYKIAFTSSQTVARTSVYLRLVENERYETLLSRLREMTQHEDMEIRKNKRWLQRVFTPHSILREEWISPLIQRMFIWLGIFCIAVAASIGGNTWLATFNNLITSTTSLNVLPDFAPVMSMIIFLTAIVGWSIFVLRHLHRTNDPLYGMKSMTRQFEQAWMKVIDNEHQSVSSKSGNL